ncbi:MAG: transketolase C-terminal domain-containing protein [Desulfotomaculaceae bacterium]|nr:transketolase C-terminal domain-containing protein [Desulfotomaculaceae bacterium]
MTTYLQSLNQALGKLLEQDEHVFIIGEDIVDPYGGAFKVTKGLSLSFPERVLPTPISEAAIVGLATGMAMRGLRPVVEIMFGDFITLAADQIINHAAKFHDMYSGKVDVPLVIRTPMGGGRGYGPTHSQSLEKIFLGIPGLKVVAPSHFHDPGVILQEAVLNDSNPVLFIEHKGLYPKELILDNNYPLHLSIAAAGSGYPTVIVKNFDHKQHKPDVALITYGGMSPAIEEIMKTMYQEEVWVVSVLPSLLSEPPAKVIAQAIETCDEVIVIEEGAGRFGWSAEIAAMFNEHLGSKCPRLTRIMSKPTVIPAARQLEATVLPSIEHIEKTIWEVLN